MAFNARQALKNGIRQFTDHPQLWLTVIVAVAIVVSYIYLANRFITIAQDAQDRLINVRVGSLQDALVPLAEILYIGNKTALRSHMGEMQELNPTITDFYIVEGSGSDWFIQVSTNEAEEHTNLVGFGPILSLAVANPSRSFTIEEIRTGERFFRSARAIPGVDSGEFVVMVTRQTLSQADKQIADSIRGGMIVLVVVLLFLLLLFFRHARIIDYSVLYKKLKEVDQMKDDFVSMASHELRAPLSAIRGYGEMLQDSKEVTSKDGNMFLDRISVSAKQLDELIVDILDVSKLQQGRLEFNNKELDPAKIITDAAESLRFRAEEKGLELKLEVEKGAEISADENRLRQVVINLVSNAIKYTPKGSITVGGKRDGNLFVLRVSDTGLGMSAEVREQLFAKFYRAEDDDVRKEQGVGLGLWITKQIIEKMRGTVSVESIEGVGSHFIVRFPIANIEDVRV